MTAPDNHLCEFESFVRDAGSRSLLRNEAVVRLKPKIFEAFLVLVRNGVQVCQPVRLPRRRPTGRQMAQP